MQKKKMVFIFVLICIMIFCIFYYIFYVSGNNIIRNQDKVVEDILESFKNYEANIDVIVKSNKNENRYNMSQIVQDDKSKVVVNSPENAKGLIIELNGTTLTVSNSKTNMKKVYENYNSLMDNSLFLNIFTEDCKNNEFKICEEYNEIIVRVNTNNQNTYKKIKELYIDKEKNIPIKLVIKDYTQNINTSIIYNDIKIK